MDEGQASELVVNVAYLQDIQSQLAQLTSTIGMLTLQLASKNSKIASLQASVADLNRAPSLLPLPCIFYFLRHRH